MPRTQYTFTFRNAEPGAAVTFSADVYSSPADQTADGPALALDASRTVAVWADVSELTATWVDGAGTSVEAEASVAVPVVVETGGVAGASPAPSGGSTQVLTAKTANYTAANGDSVLVDATTASVTITLPAPAANASVWVKKVDGGANTVTVVPHAAEHIDGSASKVITAQNAALQLSSDGTDWWVF